jgi:uncharacterized protein YyaL (SSP411 family)
MKPNRLISEKSPYLLQHAYNPVDWYPWGDEAFDKAKQENKPVFLSIGYSTCHWCHVMEKESFEDNEVAALMNDCFISIKVDREERPDIDNIYMAVCQMLTQSGGWPMTIIMIPDKKPFFAGTYIPKNGKYGRPGMTELIPRVKELWETRQQDLIKSAEDITFTLTNSEEEIPGKTDSSILETTFAGFAARYDSAKGGFGNAPKFPTPHNFYFLLNYAKQTGSNEAYNMCLHTLKEMRKGGIYDHLGYGFHRYSTDSQWLVPHFEKMLYDQALISAAYTEAYLASKDELFKQTSEEIIEYVLRDMTSPEGAFYSAEDADSEGVEGKFYTWKQGEIEKILGSDAELFIKYFNVSENGNWTDPVHGSIDRTNILHITKFDKQEQANKFKEAREKLFQHREHRIHPYKDDKVLTDWNALMISALARAAQAFNNPAYAAAAEKAADFILTRLTGNEGELLHRYRSGEAGLPAHLDDYAFFIMALIDLYETTFEINYLQLALKYTDYTYRHFRDNITGAFFFTSDNNTELIARRKDLYDGAVPSGNSAMILNLARLSRLTGNPAYENDAVKITEAFAANINAAPSAYALALTGMAFIKYPSFEIVIAGDKKNPDLANILRTIRSEYIPNKVILLRDNLQAELYNNIAPFTKDYSTAGGNGTEVYICKNFKCSLPVSTEKEVKELLGL